MRDLLPHIRPWYADGGRFAVATVIDTFRSAPRQPGAAMAVSGDGVVVGSVSGGCVEADAARSSATGRPLSTTKGRIHREPAEHPSVARAGVA
ncbi:XdhC family protein [Kribbella sp. NBC_00889]|uniref:XdhC family protein n=1 Tax=Kribbella sp. NBC_00889 TaxID=2975974 RepID=UPI00387077A4|nr:XdhC family protein [Kribbella sp. NBC_00889]